MSGKINVRKMGNNLDSKYLDLLNDIMKNGVKKRTRNGEVLSVFGREIRHNMSEGFPLLTSKKMAFKTIVTELLWFLRGDTNIKFLVDNGCRIWDGDAYKNFKLSYTGKDGEIILPPDDCISEKGELLSQEEFIEKIKTDDEFAEKWGELGPIYGSQWRSWRKFSKYEKIATYENGKGLYTYVDNDYIDQIQNLINDLKSDPDSRRLMVNAWNIGEIDEMVLPPCHYGFQVYTRELNNDEKWDQYIKLGINIEINGIPLEKNIWELRFIQNHYHKEQFHYYTTLEVKMFRLELRSILLHMHFFL